MIVSTNAKHYRGVLITILPISVQLTRTTHPASLPDVAQKKTITLANGIAIDMLKILTRVRQSHPQHF